MITLAQSLSFPMTWFIFRDTGIEVKIELKDDRYDTTHPLTRPEAKFINENLISTTLQSKINKRKRHVQKRKTNRL